MTDQIIRVKAGTTIDWQLSWLVGGKPQDLDDFDIFCQIKDTAGVLKLTMSVTKADQAIRKGSFSLHANASATSLRPGVYDCDVVYRNIASGQVESTETFYVEFLKKVSGVT